MTEAQRVALVTGAARGIGAATARLLASRGWLVVAVDVCADDPSIEYPLATKSDLDEVIGAGAGNIVGCVADVRRLDELNAAVSVAQQQFGGLDVAVAAAGVIAGGGEHWTTDAAAEQAVIDIDLMGVLNLARVAMPAILQRPGPRSGRFIAVASSAAGQGLPQLAAYCAAKAGVTGFIRALAAELQGTGITANAVSPGSTRTDILTASANIYGLASRENFAAQQPIQRLIDPMEIAALIAFVAGDGGAAITGANLPIDGGLSI